MTNLSILVQKITESSSQLVSTDSNLSVGDRITLLIAITGASYTLYKEYKERQKKLAGLFNLTWKNSTSIRKNEILGSRPFNEYYYTRQEDEKVRNCLKEGKSVLIIGPPLSGKTRMVYEALKQSKKYDIITPRPTDINIESFILPKQLKFWKLRLMFIDDLYLFAEKKNFEYLFEICRKNKINLIATCRSEIEYKKTKIRMSDKNLDLETELFDEITKINEIQEEQGKKIANKVDRDWSEIKFNKTIGSIFMPLTEMHKRFEKCTSKEKSILKAIKKLYICGVYEEGQIFQLEQIRRVSEKEGIKKENFEFEELIKKLCEKEFIKRKENEVDQILVEEVYLEDIVELNDSELSIVKQIESIFAETQETLIKIGSRAYDYGNLQTELGRKEEAGELYKVALKADLSNVNTLCNYGKFLKDIGRLKEAEEQYKFALKDEPNNVNIHCNYGNFLKEIGRMEEAKEQYEIAIKLEYNSPSIYSAYGLLLLSMNLEGEAIKEIKIASRLFGKNGDKVKEHLSLAWLYEELANKYYKLKDYKKSGEYAEVSGAEYIEAGKQAGEKSKDISFTRGFILKGKAEIRKLELQPPYNIENFIEVINGIYDASYFYRKAAEVSPKENEIYNACSVSMLCLSEMLDYMLAVINQKNVPRLEEEIGKWENQLTVSKQMYRSSQRGEAFIQSLYKLMACIENLENYKKFCMWTDERAFEQCIEELREIARNIEGPLQKIIEDSATQMDICRRKITPYVGTKTGYISNPSKLSQFLKWISVFRK